MDIVADVRDAAAHGGCIDLSRVKAHITLRQRSGSLA